MALVPTMGALHDGHLSLLGWPARTAPRSPSALFVNPTQFGAGEDLERLPARRGRATCAGGRGGGRRARLRARARGVYPDGFATAIAVAGPRPAAWRAPRRPGHFAGVATVVAKLLLAVRPDRAVFGQKDAQQVAVDPAPGARPPPRRHRARWSAPSSASRTASR